MRAQALVEVAPEGDRTVLVALRQGRNANPRLVPLPPAQSSAETLLGPRDQVLGKRLMMLQQLFDGGDQMANGLLRPGQAIFRWRLPAPLWNTRRDSYQPRMDFIS